VGRVAAAVRERVAQHVVEPVSLLGIACSVVGEIADARPVLAVQVGDAPPRHDQPLSGITVANLASL
jgi:hypothetical protein